MQKFIRKITAIYLICFTAISSAMAQGIFFTADSSNATTGVMNLSQTSLASSQLSNPTGLTTGSNGFNYVSVYFVPTNTASYTFGQTSAPVDTVMILYGGVFNALTPGNLALVGNDDTAQTTHRITLNDNSINTLCGTQAFCPQVTQNVVAGQRYTLLISTFNAGSALGLPLTFYSDGAGNFYSVAGPSAADTLASMNPNAYALRGAFIQQSAIINNGLSYDCTTFDAKGICLSAGGRVTDANNPSTNSQGALLIASYRANDNWRIGGYLDQNLSSNDPRGVNLENNNPMAGVFAVWNQNTDGTGYQVRVAAGYSDKDVTISRSVFGATGEAGKGDSSLRTQAYSATLSHGFQLNDSRWIASPYLGVRYTKIKRAGYTEDSSADVTAPLTYSGLSQETTTALAGVRFSGQLAERVSVMASAGVESDIAHNTGDYAATGVNDLTPIAFNQNVRHVRPVAQAGVNYAIDKRQTVSANLMYRQEAFNSSNSTTGMVSYQVGF